MSDVAQQTYPVGLAGVKSYQDAISGLCAGDELLVWHEPNNPYDDRALAVTTGRGKTIGYVPRDSFLREALLDRGQGCSAHVLELPETDSGAIAVVADVMLFPKHQRPIGVRQFGG